MNTVLLGEVADCTSGFAMRPTEQGLPQLRMTSITNDGTMDITGVKLVNPSVNQKQKYRLQRGDIIFTNTNCEQYVGKTALFDADGEYYFSNHLTRIRLRDERFHAGFVACYLHHLWAGGHYESLITRWVNQAAMQLGRIESIALPLVPLGEQHRIAHLLGEADRLRRLRKEAHEKSQRILPALFVEMFGNPETNPMRWELTPLGDLLESARNGTTATQNAEGNGYAVSRIETISAGEINVARTQFVTLSDEERDKWRLHEGDILFSHINSEHRIGVCALYSGEPDVLIHGMNLLALRPKRDSVLPVYLLAFLRTETAMRHWRTRTKRAVNQASINTGDLKSLPVPVPSLQAQAAFVTQAIQLQGVILRQNKSNESLRLAAAAMRSRLFAGVV